MVANPIRFSGGQRNGFLFAGVRVFSAVRLSRDRKLPGSSSLFLQEARHLGVSWLVGSELTTLSAQARSCLRQKFMLSFLYDELHYIILQFLVG